MPGGNITADGEMIGFGGTENEYTTLWGDTWNQYLHLSGDFGGGTVTVYFKSDDPTLGFLPITDGGVYTAAADDIIKFTRTMTLKVTLAGATAPDLNFNLV